jgi:hypothetical protein
VCARADTRTRTLVPDPGLLHRRRIEDDYRRARQDAGLTASELRLLPLLSEPTLSLNEISQMLQMPRGVVMELAQSIYRKLGPVGEAKLPLHSA